MDSDKEIDAVTGWIFVGLWILLSVVGITALIITIYEVFRGWQ